MRAQIVVLLDLCILGCRETLVRNPDFDKALKAAGAQSGQIQVRIYYTHDLESVKLPPLSDDTNLAGLNRTWKQLLALHPDYSKAQALLDEIRTEHPNFSVTPTLVAVALAKQSVPGSKLFDRISLEDRRFLKSLRITNPLQAAADPVRDHPQ